ncbi:MAG: hypothetical protein ACYC2U_00115 [Candidatus Amoebophilus sp.]
MDYTELQDTIQEVLMKGFLKGFKEGMRTRGLEIAENMMKNNFHMSFIEQMTGVSAEHIENIGQEL